MDSETLKVVLSVIGLVSTTVTSIVGIFVWSIRARMAKESQERKLEADDRKREADDRKREAEENRQLMINNFEGMKTVVSLYEKERDRAVTERNEMSVALGDLRSSLVEVRTRLEAEVSHLKAESIKFRDGVEEAKHVSAEQAQRLDVAEKTIYALNGEVVRLNKRNDDAVKAYEVELGKLRQVAQDKDQLIAQLEKEKQEMAVKLTQVLAELAEVRADVQKLRDEIATLRADIVEKDQRIFTLTKERDEARIEVKLLTSALKEAQQSLNANEVEARIKTDQLLVLTPAQSAALETPAEPKAGN